VAAPSSGATLSSTVATCRLSPTVRSRVSTASLNEFRPEKKENKLERAEKQKPGRRTGRRRAEEDGLPVGHLQRPQVSLDAVLSSDPIVDDLDVQLAHPAQNSLRKKTMKTIRRSVDLWKLLRPNKPLAGPDGGLTWPESGSTLTLRLGSSLWRHCSAFSRSFRKENKRV